MTFKIMVIEVAKAMPPAPRILESNIFKTIFSPTQIAVIMSGVAVFFEGIKHLARMGERACANRPMTYILTTKEVRAVACGSKAPRSKKALLSVPRENKGKKLKEL
jgi:hypothetical protein